jgi:hypothetical protein
LLTILEDFGGFLDFCGEADKSPTPETQKARRLVIETLNEGATMLKLRTFFAAAAMMISFAAATPASANHPALHYRPFLPYGGAFVVAVGPAGFWVPVIYGYSYWQAYQYQPYYASFASISYSPSRNAFGWAAQAPSRKVAQNEATTYCGGDDCQPVVWVQGGCAATATDKDAKFLGWGVGTKKYEAVDAAVKSCRQQSRGACLARAWTCSF